MEQEEIRTGPTLAGWLRRFSAHRRPVLVFIFGGWLLVVGAAWILPSKYRSETLILVEQQKVPEHYVEPNIAVDLQQRLQSMTEQILSRTRLMAIAAKFHLYGVDEKHSVADGVIDRMTKDINIELVRSTANQVSAFKVSYSAATPILAQQVTAELTSLFIEENLQNRQQLSEDTTDFLENQLDAARKNLEQQELRLREFKSRYLGQLPEQMGSNMQILTGLQNRLQSANDALNQAQQQKLYLQSLLTQYRALQPAATTDQSKGASIPSSYASTQRVQQLKAQLAELQAKYTPRHPDVVRLQQEIIEAEKAASVDAHSDEKKSSNTVNAAASVEDLQATGPMLQIQSQLKATEFEIANRKGEIKTIEGEIDSYQKRLNLAPAREQELAAITRDHEQSRAYYESLLAKRNQSEMATNLEKRQQGEQFRMIDPPSLPQRPYFPNRVLFSIAGFGFGLVIAATYVVVRELTSGKIYGEEELTQVIECRDMILIPAVLTSAETRRRSHARILDGAVALLIALTIPAATLFLYYKA